MSEFQTHSNIEADQECWKTVPTIGMLALSDLPEGVRAYSVFGNIKNEHITNFPEAALLEGAILYPKILDELTVGTYMHRTRVVISNKPEARLQNMISFVIKTDEQGDRSVRIGDQIQQRPHFAETVQMSIGHKGKQKIHEQLGFEFTEDQATAFPTPLTLVKKAKQIGVGIELLDYGEIPYNHYLAVFSRGNYPVAVAEPNYYVHDTDETHLSGLILGGMELQEALAASAQQALRNPSAENIEATAEELDFYTGFIGVIVRQSKNSVIDQTEDLISSGLKLSIAENTTRSILATAREKLAEYTPVGMYDR